METITLQVPNSKLEPLKKLANKISRKVSFITVEFGNSYKKMYIHTGRDVDKYYFEKKVWHEVTDVTIKMDTINDWILLVSYKDGLEFIANPSKELVLKNPEHGKDYGKCDSCGHKCKNSSIVYNTKTGEELQVGNECLKQFGLSGLDFVCEFTKELYKFYDYYTSDGDGDFPLWSWGEDSKFAYSSCRTTDLLRAAKAYYNENKEWKKGYYYCNEYQKSASNEKIQNNLASETFDGDEDYINKVIEFVKGIKTNNDFSCKMIEMVKNVYTEPCYSVYAFFAIKNYEDSIKAKQLNMERFKTGLQVHVVGKVSCKKTLSTMFGDVDEYTIEVGGILFKRTGKISVDNNNMVDFYAIIKFVKGTQVFLDRALKNPKKGVETISL